MQRRRSVSCVPMEQDIKKPSVIRAQALNIPHMAGVRRAHLPTWSTKSMNSATNVKKVLSPVTTNRTASFALAFLSRRVAQAARIAREIMWSIRSTLPARCVKLEKGLIQIAPSVWRAKGQHGASKASASRVMSLTSSTRAIRAALSVMQDSSQTQIITIAFRVPRGPTLASGQNVSSVMETESSLKTRLHVRPARLVKGPMLIF